MRNGDFSGLAAIRDPSGTPYPNNRIPTSQLDPNAALLTNTFYPLPNRSGAPNFVYNTVSFTLYREELIRWDHNFSDRWIWTTRYAQDDWSQNQDIARPGGPGALPTFPNILAKPGKNLTTKLTTIFNPALVNLFTFGYSYNEITNVPIGGFRPSGLNIPQAYPSNRYNVIPDITLAQGYVGLGIGGPLNNSNPLYTFKDDLSWILGRHTFKFGFELIRTVKQEINNSNEQGAFNFNGGVTGNAFADFLIGRAFTYIENGPDSGIEVSNWDNEVYVQDDFRVSPKLTINAGLRLYFIRGRNGGAAAGDNISTFVPSLYDRAKAPAILSNGQLVAGTGEPLNGIITATNNKRLDVGRSLTRPLQATAPRFGLAYSLNAKTVLRGGYGINSFWGTGTNVPRRNNPPFNSSVNIQNTLLSNPLGGTSTLFPPNVDSVEVFAKAPWVQSWSFTIQRELAANTSLEIGYAGTKGTHLPRTVQLNQGDPASTVNVALRRPYLGYASMPYNENSAESHYHSLQASVTRRFSRGLMFEASYTYSKALGHPEGMPLDSRNKNLDYGLLDLDRTHLFSFNYVWELPFFKAEHGVVPAVLGGWQISGITSFQSGLPFNLTQSGDVANFGGNTGAQRPDIIADPNTGGGTIDRWFNTAAFRAVTQTGRVGTSPVNPVRGPGIANFDISLLKNVPIRERLRFQFGIETFNTFNHTQFEGVGGALGSATFGVVTGARDPRVMQARAKMSW
jgi:hypothetical protein